MKYVNILEFFFNINNKKFWFNTYKKINIKKNLLFECYEINQRILNIILICDALRNVHILCYWTEIINKIVA